MKRKKTKLNFLILGITALGLVFSLPALWHLAVNSYKLYSLKSRLKNLELENSRLKNEIKQTQQIEYIEKIARIKLGLKRSDEIEYRFISGEENR